MSGELALRIYVFAIYAVSVVWALAVLWLAAGRWLWRWLARSATRHQTVDG